jgi:NitT/TauT family transport system permease protein
MASVEGTSGRSAVGSPVWDSVLARAVKPRVLWRLASIATLLLVWELAGRSEFNFAFPTFLETAAAFWRMVADGSMGAAYLKTLEPLVLGVAIALVGGVAAGVLMGLREEIEWLTLPVFIVMQAAPMAALIPLVTFVYGIGLAAKIFAVVVLAMPVIAINSYRAVRNVSPSLVDMCRSFMGSRRQQLATVILPAASPMIFAGVRLGVAEGFSGVVLAELLITPTGIGDLITYHRSVANYAHMYATIVSIVVFAVVTVGVLQWVEIAVFRPEKRSAR